MDLNELFTICFSTRKKQVKFNIYQVLIDYKPKNTRELMKKHLCIEFLTNQYPNDIIGFKTLSLMNSKIKIPIDYNNGHIGNHFILVITKSCKVS